MDTRWVGLGALETPLGGLAFLLSDQGVAAVRLGYADWEAALDAVVSLRKVDSHCQMGLSRCQEARSLTVGLLRWCGLGENSQPTELASRLADEFARYFAGETVDFGSIPLDFGQATVFQRQVWRACRSIRFGETMSYGGLAARIGRASAVRAVGRALGANPIPLIIPCHRVVSADGDLRGYSGYGGTVTKRKLLELERAAIEKPTPESG